VSELNEFVQLMALVIRGVLLWIAVPVAVIAWAVIFWMTKARLGACLGWFDLNLNALIQRVILRPFIRKPPALWVPLSGMATTEHRIAFLGFW
jgi:hypothetical protein